MGDTDPDRAAVSVDGLSRDRLESWKEIATYLGKDTRTVQRWEKRAGLPVHRHADGSVLNVYAYRSELDAWQHQDRALPANGTNGADDGRADGVLPNPSSDQSTLVSSRIAFGRRHATWVAAAAVVTLVAVGGAWVLRTGQPLDLPFEQDDYVLITQFDNLTGEPLFDDGTLEAVLELALSDSGFLHVAPRERVEDALRLMRHPPNTVVDKSVGREVALRDGGIRVVLAGAIEMSGSAYVLTVQLVNPEDGQVLASVREEASGEAAITAAIQRQASRVRERLGEALPLIEASEQRLERVTTPSLRALQLYTHGYWLYRGSSPPGNVPASEPLFLAAIKEDPSFAAAHLMLGYAIRDIPRRRRPQDEWLPHFIKAVDLAEGAVVRDRLFIEGAYFSATGQYEKAIPKYEALLDLQPDHYFAGTNVRGAYLRLGREPPVELTLRPADLRPHSFRLQMSAAKVLLRRGQLSRASAYMERARAVRPDPLEEQPGDTVWLAFFPAYAHWFRGEIDEAFKTVEALVQPGTARSREDQQLYTGSAGSFYFAFGQLGKAEELFESSPEANRASLSALAAVRNDQEGVKEHLSGVRFPQWRLFRQVRIGLPLDPVEVAAEPQGFQQLLEGELALRRQHWRAAIDLLRPGVEWLRLGVLRATFYEVSESLATAWHEVGDERKALRVLEKALQEGVLLNGSGRILGAFNRLRLQARLAREYRKVGRVNEAVEIEDEVLRMLKYADADHPIVLQIREAQNNLAQPTL